MVGPVRNNFCCHGRGDSWQTFKRTLRRSIDVDRIAVWVVPKAIANSQGGSFDIIRYGSSYSRRSPPNNVLASRTGGAAGKKQ